MLFSLGSLKRRVCTWSSGCPGAANIASRCMLFELRASALMCFFKLEHEMRIAASFLSLFTRYRNAVGYLGKSVE